MNNPKGRLDFKRVSSVKKDNVLEMHQNVVHVNFCDIMYFRPKAGKSETIKMSRDVQSVSSAAKSLSIKKQNMT